MKKLKMFLIIFLPILLLVVLKFSVFTNSIKMPDKVLIYDHGVIVKSTITNDDLNKIVYFTNKRVGNFLEKYKDAINNESLNEIKNESIGIEFIYSTQQKLYLTYFTEIRYNRLYFQLISDQKDEGHKSTLETLQYGDKEEYFGSSIGDLKHSDKLIEIINKYQ